MFAKLRALFSWKHSKKPHERSITVAQSGKGKTSETKKPTQKQKRKHQRPLFLSFSVKERVFFAKRLAFLVKSGVSVVESMTMIRNQTRSKRKQRVYDSTIADITAGQFLSKSLEQHSDLFGEFTINLIKVGEEAGILGENLIYLADELAKKQALQRKVYGALVYPIFITIATLGVTSILTVYIFPKLMPIFTSLHVELPLTTRVLIGVSAYLRDWGLYTALGVAAVIGILLIIRNKYERVRLFGDRIILYIPLAGSIVRAYNLTNFCRTLGLLLRSGITFSESLSITAETTKNRVYRIACQDMTKRIIRGEPLSRGLAEYPNIYPDILTHMISIGERTGSLSTTLSYLGEMFESEVDGLTKNLSSSIEPVLMVVMGLLVGTIAVSVITPIYSITQHLSPK